MYNYFLISVMFLWSLRCIGHWNIGKINIFTYIKGKDVTNLTIQWCISLLIGYRGLNVVLNVLYKCRTNVNDRRTCFSDIYLITMVLSPSPKSNWVSFNCYKIADFKEFKIWTDLLCGNYQPIRFQEAYQICMKIAERWTWP